jgi:transcriptional regulator with AAA-type ATPase domain
VSTCRAASEAATDRRAFNLRIADLVGGAEPLPAHGKSAVLLYGVSGTGKTTLARLLPSAIEQGRWQQELVIPEQLIEC